MGYMWFSSFFRKGTSLLERGISYVEEKAKFIFNEPRGSTLLRERLERWIERGGAGEKPPVLVFSDKVQDHEISVVICHSQYDVATVKASRWPKLPTVVGVITAMDYTSKLATGIRLFLTDITSPKGAKEIVRDWSVRVLAQAEVKRADEQQRLVIKLDQALLDLKTMNNMMMARRPADSAPKFLPLRTRGGGNGGNDGGGNEGSGGNDGGGNEGSGGSPGGSGGSDGSGGSPGGDGGSGGSDFSILDIISA